MLVFVFIFFSSSNSLAADTSCASLFGVETNAFSESLRADFSFRDALPETLSSLVHWQPQWGKWGPHAIRFPKPDLPPQVDSVVWARHRVKVVAQKYIGLSYKHRHIPSLGGLDCSNFTAWVYNYGLGLKISSNVAVQALEAGRMLAPNDKFKMGDLLFQWNREGTQISHVVMYLENGKVIDSSTGGVQVRDWDGWRKYNFAWARRIIEE